MGGDALQPIPSMSMALTPVQWTWSIQIRQDLQETGVFRCFYRSAAPLSEEDEVLQRIRNFLGPSTFRIERW